MSKEAMKLALEALERVDAIERGMVTTSRHHYQAKEDTTKAITALREALAEQPAQQEPVAWAPYLSDRADGVSGHYAIARWNPRGYREVWNLRRHAWAAYSDDVLSLEEADTLLRLIEIPTRKVESPPAQRTWVGLTEQEALDCFSPNPVTHSKNVEAKLKEKNT